MGQVKQKMYMPKQEGKQAAILGLERDSNPYDDLIERSYWFIGYDLIADDLPGLND